MASLIARAVAQDDPTEKSESPSAYKIRQLCYYLNECSHKTEMKSYMGKYEVWVSLLVPGAYMVDLFLVLLRTSSALLAN